MRKEFFVNRGVLVWGSILLALSVIGTVIFAVLYKGLSTQLLDAVLGITIVCWGCLISLVIVLIFYGGMAEINDEGILFRYLFKFRKFKRFFKWEEIDEIEIMKLLFLKGIYISRKHFIYGHKVLSTMKNNPDMIILATGNKKIIEAIQQYYKKEIISGRTFKNTQD